MIFEKKQTKKLQKKKKKENFDYALLALAGRGRFY